MNNEGHHRQIIGVVKDFHYGSLHEQMEPFVLSYTPYGRNIFVKIKSGTEETTLNRLNEYYKKFHTGCPMEFTFLDEDYQRLYNSEMWVGALSKYFPAIAIAIPVSYFITRSWLLSFAYRIHLGSGYFLAAGFFTLFIALSIVGIQTIKAGQTNPVKYLTEE